MVTIKNDSKAVKVLKAWGLKTLRISPGFNYVDCTSEELAEYFKTEVNKAITKENLSFPDGDLTDKEDAEAKNALKINEKLNKAQKVIDKQNKQILKKDKESDKQQAKINDLNEKIEKMAKQIEKMEKKEKR